MDGFRNVFSVFLFEEVVMVLGEGVFRRLVGAGQVTAPLAVGTVPRVRHCRPVTQ